MVDDKLKAEILELAREHARRKEQAQNKPRPRRRRRHRDQDKDCARKEAYTYDMALLVCRRIKDHQHKIVQPYKCRGHWHVGSVFIHKRGRKHDDSTQAEEDDR